MILPKCAICDSKKSRFIKNQEGKGLLSKLGIKTPLSKISILGDNLFYKQCMKMNEIDNKFLLAGDKFMSEMHLKKLDLLIVHMDHLLKIKNEFKNLEKQEIRTVFTKTNLIMLVFNMIGHMKILKI